MCKKGSDSEVLGRHELGRNTIQPKNVRLSLIKRKINTLWALTDEWLWGEENLNIDSTSIY